MTKSENKFATQRRDAIKMLGIGSASGLLGLFGSADANAATYDIPSHPGGMVTAKAALKITDLKCAIIGGSAVVRITTNECISGYGQSRNCQALP